MHTEDVQMPEQENKLVWREEIWRTFFRVNIDQTIYK